MSALESDPRSVSGHVALVTGAASGMGRATAELFAAEGALVAAVDRDGDGVDEVVAGIEAAHGPGRAAAWPLDVADPVAITAVVAAVVERLGPVDIVVNNAGISRIATVDGDAAAYDDAWAQTLAVNLTAHQLVVRACLADLTRHGRGRVVNIASTEGLGASRGIGAYTTAKHGVIGLTRSLAVELGSTGVTVNAVCPGPIRTAMTAPISDESKDRYARRRVALRRYGDPVEVAHMILSLCLPAASFTTGAVLAVDGGMSIKND